MCFFWTPQDNASLGRSEQPTSLGEALGAVRAAKRLLFVVEALVGDQIAVADVALATEGAPVRFCARMHVQVSCEVAPLDEALAALLAVEPLVLLRKLRK